MMWVCNPDCKGGCCGVIPFDKEFIRNNKHLFQVPVTKEFEDGTLVAHITEDRKCVFLNRETWLCMVYHARPEICRIFGQNPKLLCPYIDMKGKPRKPHEVKWVARKMDKVMDKRYEKLTSGRKEVLKNEVQEH
jgi:Fe-S-cluster containining protein